MQTETTTEQLGAEIVKIESELAQIAGRKNDAIADGDHKAFRAAESARDDAESRLDFARARLTKAKHDEAEAERASKLSQLAIHADACSLATYRAAIRPPLAKMIDALERVIEAHDQILAIAHNAEQEFKSACGLAESIGTSAPADIRPVMRAMAETAVELSDKLGARASKVAALLEHKKDGTFGLVQVPLLAAFRDDWRGTARSNLLEHVSRLLGTATYAGQDVEEQLASAIDGGRAREVVA